MIFPGSNNARRRLGYLTILSTTIIGIPFTFEVGSTGGGLTSRTLKRTLLAEFTRRSSSVWERNYNAEVVAAHLLYDPIEHN